MIKNTNYLLFIICLIVSNTSSAQSIKILSLQPGPEDGKDAWIWSGERTKEANFGIEQPYNQGLHNVIRAEVWKWFGQEESDTIRSFLAFDLSEIPHTATILEAKLTLYFFANDGFTPQLGENELRIEMVSEDWDETKISWVNQPSVRTDFSIFLDKSLTQDQDYTGIDIRSMVQEMVYFPDSNYGFRFALLNEQPYNGLTFASSDHENASIKPKLFIRYQTNQ